MAISHSDAMQTRLNKTVGKMNQVNGMFAFQSIRGANPSIFNFQDTSRQLGMRSNINWLHRFNQHAFLTLGAEYSRLQSTTTPYFANRENVSGAAGISGNLQDAADWGPPSLTFASGIQPLTDANQSLTRNQSTGGSADLFWSRSPHNIHVGMDARRQQLNYLGSRTRAGHWRLRARLRDRISGTSCWGCRTRCHWLMETRINISARPCGMRISLTIGG